MADSVIFLKKGGEGYYEEKKSRFLAAAYRISDEQEALAYIEAARKKYWDARHSCYAYSHRWASTISPVLLPFIW